MTPEIQNLRREIGKVFVGQEDLVTGVLTCLLGGGHALLEGMPGLGKTLLVRTLGGVLGLDFARIQFTPDLMPTDVTGTQIYNQKNQEFVFHRGPVFTHILLADEINRSPAKTHSALLEIMQEQQITLDNQTYKIDAPFLVLATQNPIESEGTYALPEAALDRFLLKLKINYPGEQEELEILRLQTRPSVEQAIARVITRDQVLELQNKTAQIHVANSVLTYINSLVRATRQRREIYVGASPRAGIALLKTARAVALLAGRTYVVPDDVKKMAHSAMRHRLLLLPEVEVEGKTPDDIIDDLLATVPVPKDE
ncbi:MAG TPA: MoxR family ATPase [Leptospiraceae bacterium]|nr:MoxR family ATPase [Leptospirales bacterium]HMW59324.1 MoxR family ATPase [Leptospiraceae bacterium]HMX55327.1 MoxR family ATPase [Leptospiraceae bacterium]HMY45442.1 MoxR family ATPase [Leptospiraceae bacterium]HMZ36047.1 MoxR family ATPase [Leptospiraceae bacterium]